MLQKRPAYQRLCIDSYEKKLMNSNNDTPITFTIGTTDDESESTDEKISGADYDQQSRCHLTRSSAGSISSNGTTTTTSHGPKRQKEVSPCYVCGAKAHGYNFDQITCESCKAFFRRNALKSMDKFRCRNNENCVVTSVTRKRCKRCRLIKCFKVGMRKEWILTDEEKYLKREKIVRNRLKKQQGRSVSDHPINSSIIAVNSLSPSSQIEQSLTNPFQLMYMYRPADQQMYERQQYLLEQLSNGYHLITKDYPQPSKFLDRNIIISQTYEMESKLTLVKDLTRELTQMTTSRLLNFFNLIPEFQLLAQEEKQALLIQNMLAVFMFHGALTYNPDNDTFVDSTTADQPYDAKYLLFVYGPKVYNTFIALARELTSTTCSLINDKQSYEHAHTLFLLLLIVLLFSNGGQLNSTDDDQSKIHKIQHSYIDIACRYLNDRFGFTVGRRMFKKLVPLLIDLQNLCSTLANVNLCEMVDDEDRSSTPVPSSTECNSTMISGRSHLNELQKENRAPALPPPPPPSDSSSVPLTVRSLPSVLSNTTTTLHNYRI